MDYSFPPPLPKFTLVFELVLTPHNSFLMPKLSSLADFGAVLQTVPPDCTLSLYVYIYLQTD